MRSHLLRPWCLRVRVFEVEKSARRWSVCAVTVGGAGAPCDVFSPPPAPRQLLLFGSYLCVFLPMGETLVELDESPSTCGFFTAMSRTSIRVEVRRLDLMHQSSSRKLQQIDVKAHTVVAVGVLFARGQKRMLENDGTAQRASVMRPVAAAGCMGGAPGGLHSARDTNDAGRQCSISPPAIGKLPPVAPLTRQSPRTARIGLWPALWGVTSRLIIFFFRLLACLICLPAQPPGGRHGRSQ